MAASVARRAVSSSTGLTLTADAAEHHGGVAERRQQAAAQVVGQLLVADRLMLGYPQLVNDGARDRAVDELDAEPLRQPRADEAPSRTIRSGDGDDGPI